MAARDTTNLGINDQEMINTIKALERVLARVNKPENKRKILRRQAKKIVLAARNSTPVGKRRVNKLYDTTKLLKNRRASRGFGKVKASFLRGNLQGSIKVLTLRKTSRVFVGPRILKRVKQGATYGPKRPNAYYAQMIYGSAKAFKAKVMVPALNSSRSAVIKGLQKSIQINVRKYGKSENIGA